jgi:hypothetical protein
MSRQLRSASNASASRVNHSRAAGLLAQPFTSVTTKSDPLPPIVADDMATSEHVEMRDIIATGPQPIPPEQEIMKLAIQGDEIGIRRLLNEKKVEATVSDFQNITPLHVRRLTLPASVPPVWLATVWTNTNERIHYSGQPSTIAMQSARCSLTPAQT